MSPFKVFIDLLPISLMMFIVKLIAIPLLTWILVLVVKTIWMRFKTNEEPFPVKAGIAQLNSIILVAFLINAYWFFVVKFNGVTLFSWDSFSIGFNNIYFMLSPLLVSYILLVVMYFKTQSNIQKVI